MSRRYESLVGATASGYRVGGPVKIPEDPRERAEYTGPFSNFYRRDVVGSAVNAPKSGAGFTVAYPVPK